MAINTFKIRKWGALLFVGLFTVICFYIGLAFYSFLIGLGTMMGGLLASVLVSNIMLKNPFSDMLEGKGILFLNLDSTGVIQPSIIGLDAPYVKGKFRRKPINDVWDRSNVLQMAKPEKNKNKAKPLEQGGFSVELDDASFNKNRFALWHYPVLIWNDQIKSFLTKDDLAEKEKATFAEHHILFLNRRVEDLTAKIRDFARYVVETTKPSKGLLGSTWFWVIIVIVIIIIAALFAPAVINAIKGFGSGATSAVSAASGGGNPITPR